MIDADGNGKKNYGPHVADVESQIAATEALEGDKELMERAAQAAGAVAFVHFDPNTTKSNMVEALVHHDDLPLVHRGLYVRIVSTKDGREYSGRIVEGPFYNPDALKRDSTPVRFIILNQGQGKTLALPEYHGWVQIEILGEHLDGVLLGATRRPHPASPIFPYDSSMMEGMLNLRGNMLLGELDSYEDVFVRVDGDDKNVVPRNWLTVGTIGSGKSNTDQVFIEESLAAGYAQIVVDPEGEYVLMDKPSDALGIEEQLATYGREPRGVPKITVYRPPRAESKRSDAVPFSVRFDSLDPGIIEEITEMNTAQRGRFAFLYEQATQLLRKQEGKLMDFGSDDDTEDVDVSRGYPGITLNLLISMLDEEIAYYEYKRTHKEERPTGARSKRAADTVPSDNDVAEAPLKIYCHEWQLEPLVKDYQDVTSYGALRKKLRQLRMMGIFDRTDAEPLNPECLCQPGQLSIIDMSDARDQTVTNIVIADLLAKVYHYKMRLTEEQNAQRKVFITLEEAHGFVSREKQEKMEQTLDQLRRIARRGRKRWLALHFITQSPQHLPSELFELANNKIIHQTTGSENLRVLKAAAGNVNEGIWEDVPSLGRGRAIIVSSQYPHPIIGRIRPAASRRNYTQ
jgi:DNA helicase HerA-like ATPase